MQVDISGIRDLASGQVLRVIRKDGKDNLEAVVRSKLGWFYSGTVNLSRVCQVATPALDSIPFWDYRAKAGVEQLQKRALHYALRHGTTPEISAFLKAADEFLRPVPGFVMTVVNAIAGALWPFGGPQLLSEGKLYLDDDTAIAPHSPQVRQNRSGKVSVDELPDISAEGVFRQKLAMLGKILEGKTDSGSLEYREFQSPTKESLLQVAAEVGRRPMVTNSYKRSFDYSAAPNHFTCTVNFADHGLFRFWRSPLFAQDEIQVLEHPDLGRLESHLSSWTLSRPKTESSFGRPTPWLIKGVKRHGVVHGVYGDQLMHLTPKEAKSYVSRLSTPTESNILAMAAISHGSGSAGRNYNSHDILKQFQTAFTAFKGAKQEAMREGKPLVIQTGNWGTGAFGNDPELMAIIQILAARYAGVDRLDYYTHDANGQRAYDRAQKFMNELDKLRDAGATPTLGAVLRVVYQADFRIGKSNGT